MIKMIDIQKQEALRKFVEEEVYTCQSMLVEAGFKQGFFSWDDVENLYYPEDNQEIQEIYEWWVVSDWLSILLRKLGEPMLNNEYGTWWGRCATGQAVYLDGVINKIYDEVMK